MQDNRLLLSSMPEAQQLYIKPRLLGVNHPLDISYAGHQWWLDNLTNIFQPAPLVQPVYPG